MLKTDMIITSRQNTRVKRLSSLADKKGRDAEGAFRFDGIKLFREAINCGIEIEAVYLKESASDILEKRIGKELSELSEDRVIFLSDQIFDKISEEKSPEGIITVAKCIDKWQKIDKIEDRDLPSKNESVLLLESVRDPGNLGTMIRSAAALGVDMIVMSSDCADIYNPKVIRAAMGGLFRVRIARLGAGLLHQYIEALKNKGKRVFAATLSEDAKILGEYDTEIGDCYVVGNEGHGLSQEIISSCSGSVIIPMKEGCESLNAAAASVILMWEMRKAKK